MISGAVGLIGKQYLVLLAALHTNTADVLWAFVFNGAVESNNDKNRCNDFSAQ